jgi:hypothetical protein
MSRLPSLRAVPWLAVGGLLAGHAIATVLTPPHAAGDLHGYLAWAGRAGTVAATLGLAVLLTTRLTGAGGPSPSVAQLAGRLAAVQSVGFVVMETTERVANHASVGDLVALLPVGLVIQVAIAVTIAGAVRWLLRATDLAYGALGRPATPPRSSFDDDLPPAVSVPRTRVHTLRRGRAPPAWAPPLPA